MGLRVHVYAICWNESGMLPHFLRYYSAFCEKIFIYDNCSTDGSHEICKQFAKVHTKSYFTDNQIRDDIYLKIKNDCWKNSRGNCDYVVICDIDEFIYHPELPGFLEESHKKGVSLFRCKGYNMISQNYPAADAQILQTIKEGTRSESFDKTLILDPNKIEEINYEFGSHGCSPIGELQFSVHEIKLLHYKYMGLDHMVTRYKEMGSRLSRQNKKLKLGHHYLFSSGKIKKEFRQVWEKREQVVF